MGWGVAATGLAEDPRGESRRHRYCKGNEEVSLPGATVSWGARGRKAGRAAADAPLRPSLTLQAVVTMDGFQRGRG